MELKEAQERIANNRKDEVAEYLEAREVVKAEGDTEVKVEATEDED